MYVFSIGIIVDMALYQAPNYVFISRILVFRYAKIREDKKVILLAFNFILTGI